MQDRSRDLLLLAGKAICIFMQGAMIVGGAALLIAIPAIAISQTGVLDQFGAAEAFPPGFPVWALLGMMAVGFAMVAMVFLFFRNLRRIIGTVGEGDPFAPVNAVRLAQMGWLALGIQLVTIPAVAFTLPLAAASDEAENFHLTFDRGFDAEDILLPIVLFILARVFRHGAAMREDLEGTV